VFLNDEFEGDSIVMFDVSLKCDYADIYESDYEDDDEFFNYSSDEEQPTKQDIANEYKENFELYNKNDSELVVKVNKPEGLGDTIQDLDNLRKTPVGSLFKEMEINKVRTIICTCYNMFLNCIDINKNNNLNLTIKLSDSSVSFINRLQVSNYIYKKKDKFDLKSITKKNN